MKRKTKLRWIELGLVLLLLCFAVLYQIPYFLNAQNINTPNNFPDPNFRKVIENFMGVEPGGRISPKQAAQKMRALAILE